MLIAVCFFLVYFGMFLGNIPGFSLDRTGIALLGGIVILLFAGLTSNQLIQAVDWSTIAMLFGLMILSAQFYYSGFYSMLIQKVRGKEILPKLFLLLVILISGILSALLINDIVCFALVPLLVPICLHKSWNPKPFLLGLGFAANLGSAMTLIGNPQNILVSEVLHLSFGSYFRDAALPAFLSLFFAWWVLCFLNKNSWHLEEKIEERAFEPVHIDPWQIIKAVLILLILLVFFIFTEIPRYQLVLGGAGILLLSRKMTSEKMLGFIDWPLLVLFLGLFLVNSAFIHTGLAQNWVGNIDFKSPVQLYSLSFFLTNLVSNVPTMMLLLPFVQSSDQGAILAISSTLAGNLILIGSIANLIVVTRANGMGIHITWKDHFKAGFPITIGSIILSVLWLFLKYSI